MKGCGVTINNRSFIRQQKEVYTFIIDGNLRLSILHGCVCVGERKRESELKKTRRGFSFKCWALVLSLCAPLILFTSSASSFPFPFTFSIYISKLDISCVRFEHM